MTETIRTAFQKTPDMEADFRALDALGFANRSTVIAVAIKQLRALMEGTQLTPEMILAWWEERKKEQAK